MIKRIVKNYDGDTKTIIYYNKTIITQFFIASSEIR